MANVEVLLNLVQNVKKEIAKTKKEMKTLEEDLHANLSIHDNGEIEKRQIELQQLARDRISKIKPDISESKYASTKAKIESLTKDQTVQVTPEYQWIGAAERWNKKGEGFVSSEDVPDDVKSRKANLDATSTGKRNKSVDKEKRNKFSPAANMVEDHRKRQRDLATRFPLSDSVSFHENARKAKEQVTRVKEETKETTKNAKKTSRSLRRGSRNAKTFASRIRSAVPSMRMWWNILATILPIMIALGTAIAGAAAAMGTLVGAGAAFVGLGLMGHGEGIADSMALAKRRMNELKRELFRTLRPALNEFAPISERFFSTLSRRIQPIVDSLRGLTEFEDTFFNIFDGAVGWVADLLSTLTSLKGEMDTIFGGMSGVGQMVLNLLERAVKSTANNIGFFKNLATTLWDALAIIYNLSMAFSRMVVALKPVISILKTVSGLLNNRIAGAFLQAVAIVGLMTYATRGLAIMLTGTFLNSIKYALGGLSAYISYIKAAIASTNAFRAAIASTGVGLILLGGGYLAAKAMSNDPTSAGSGGSGSRMGRSGSGNTYNTTFNVQGDLSNDQIMKMEDVSRSVGEERDYEESMRSY